MKLVVTIAAIDPQHGGPARTVPALCRALVEQGIDLELVTVAENRKNPQSLALQGIKATAIATAATRYQPRAWAKQFRETLREGLRAKDALLYDVGLWLPSNHCAAQIAAETGRPRIISPRGMLSKDALKVSKWKKRTGWALYQRRDLRRAQLLHATSQKEAHELRARGLSLPIAIVPNGIEVPEAITEPETREKGQRTLLFLSRLHPIKGLKDLVHGWANVRPSGWRVVIAGPNENNHQQEIESLAESLGAREAFDFVGPVNDEEKWKLLANADLFVLPSYSESFGMAIAEALAAGVPVITTRATPWRDIEIHKCGWWVNTGVDSITQALRSATACDSQELREIGRRGRALVQTKYSWELAAKQLISTFQWVLGHAEKPACVV